MRLPPNFPRDHFRPADDEFASLLLGSDNHTDLVLDVLGRNWIGMSRCNQEDTAAWFMRGEPAFAVVGVSDDRVGVWCAGPDVEYFDPEADGVLVATVERGFRTGDLLRSVESALDAAAELERQRRTWCRQCGRFAASADPTSTGLCFNCRYSWRLGMVF